MNVGSENAETGERERERERDSKKAVLGIFQARSPCPVALDV